MRAFLVISGLLLCGCDKFAERTSTKAAAPQKLTVLDQALAKHSNSIAQARQELPGDAWENKPFRHDVSAGKRAAAITAPMVDEIKLQLKEMTVTNLVKSFKVVPYPYGDMTNDLGAVAEWVYAVGNQLIINEIKSRPADELRRLCKLGSEKVMLVEGPQGFGLPLTHDLAEILEDRGLTNGWSR